MSVAQAQEPNPSPGNGQTLWPENCLPCHGQTGQGDGPTAASIAGELPDFTDATAMRAVIPAVYFETIKEGRIDKMMPPWKNRFEDSQLWDLTAHVLLQPVPSEELAAGKTIYAEQCASCHGESGQSAQVAVDLSDWSAMSQLSLVDLQAGYTAAADHASLTLTDDALWSTLNHVRTLAFNMPRTDGVLSGQVINRTTGEPLGGGMVALHVLQNNTKLDTRVVQADEQGNYQFTDLPVNHALSFMVESDYNGIFYLSPEAAFFEPDSAETTLNLDVYDTTADDADIYISQLHYLIVPNPDVVEIIQIMVFGNRGNDTYIGQDGQTIAFQLPKMAEGVQFQNDMTGDRFLETEGGYNDTEPIMPGEEGATIVVSYLIPHENGVAAWDFSAPTDVEAATVLLQDSGASLSSDVLQFSTVRDIQGDKFQLFTAAELQSGDTVAMKLTDLDKLVMVSDEAGGQMIAPQNGSLDQQTLIWGILGIGGLMILFGAVAYPMLGATISGQANRREWLVLMVARLDEAFEAGELDETIYRQKRADYKAELVSLIEE